MTTRLARLAALLLALAPLAGCSAKSPALAVTSHSTPGRLFESRGPFSLELRGPLKSVFSERTGERTYHPGVISYSDASGEVVNVDVRLRIRGRSRSKAET